MRQKVKLENKNKNNSDSQPSPQEEDNFEINDNRGLPYFLSKSVRQKHFDLC